MLLHLIPANLSRVLEIGCAEGNLGAAYRDMNPASNWYGLDMHGPAVEIAKTKLNYANVCDANEPIFDSKIWGDKFDCLVYADVIEHFIDPEKTLKDHLMHLNEGGFFITCIPNIQHWSTLLELIHGRWEYQKTGLMDATHLRFFTKNSVNSLLQNLGMDVEKIVPVNPKVGATLVPYWDDFEEIKKDISQLMAKYKSDAAHEDFLAYQYIFVARKHQN